MRSALGSAASSLLDPSASVYLARWALRQENQLFVEAFAPRLSFTRRLLVGIPSWLIAWTSRVIARCLLPFIESNEITDGNVNFSFAVCGRGGCTLFVKQARDYLKWQPQMSLERERMSREVGYFGDVSAAVDDQIAGRFLPAIPIQLSWH